MFEKKIKENHELNLKHALDPEVGDYWQEMFMPICVVVDATQFSVTVCDKTKSVGENRWTWDISKLEVYSREDFGNRYRYGNCSAEAFKATDTDDIKNRFWCNVAPGAHKWVREALEEKQHGA